MTCGREYGWRALAERALTSFRGVPEHFAIQADFLLQPQRDPRTEYSIPGASKRSTSPGSTGFADLASLATGEVWEVKNREGEVQAGKEAAHYVARAKRSCPGPAWHVGRSYTTSRINQARYGSDIVFKVAALESRLNVNIELHAWQGVAGAVLYEWRINGRPDPVFVRKWFWALGGAIIEEYRLQPLPTGGKGPAAPVFGNFGTPVLLPQDVMEEFRRIVPQLDRSVRRVAPQVVEHGVVEILVEKAVFDALQQARGRAQEQRTRDLLQAPVPASTRALDATARPVLVMAGRVLAVTAVVAVVVGVVLVVVLGAPEIAAGGAAATAVTASTAAVDGALAYAGAAAAGLVWMLWPKVASAADVRRDPYNASAFLPLVRTPEEARGSSLGASRVVAGQEWRVVGVARPVLPGS